MSKGRKKPSLRDLSTVVHLNDDHTRDLIDELENQSDRGVALIAAATLDVSLKKAMRCRVVDFKDGEEILFNKDGAPLSTFSDRIKIARAMGVIGPLTEAHLDTVRRIRNQFAHSPLKIDFTNSLIAAEINKLTPDKPDWKPEWTPQRRRYVGTIILLGDALENVAQQHLHDTILIWTA